MIIEKVGDKFVVSQQCRRKVIIDGERLVYLKAPTIVTENIYETDTEEDAKKYVIKCIDKDFRHTYYNLEKENPEWSYSNYKPITKDLEDKMRGELYAGMERANGTWVKKYRIMTLDEQKAYKDKYLDIIIKRHWQAFENRYNNLGLVKSGSTDLMVKKYTEENIEWYKTSELYQKYMSEIIQAISKLMGIYVKEPVVYLTSEPQNAAEAINNAIQNFNNRKTAPTLKEGWVLYIIIMLLEIIFYNTIGLWIPTTIIFLIWRRNEIKKYNGDDK